MIQMSVLQNKIDVARISKDVAALIKKLEAEIKDGDVEIPVHDVNRVTSGLETLIKPNPAKAP